MCHSRERREYLAWSPDGRALAFNVVFDAYPAEIIVADWTKNEPTLTKLARPKDVSVYGYGSLLCWKGKTDLCFLGDEKARVRLWCVHGVCDGKQGDAEVLTEGDVVVSSFNFSPRGVGTVLMNDTAHTENVYLVKEGASPQRITNLNPQVDTWKIPQYSIVQWKGAGGVVIEGVIELPPDYQPGKPLPLIVQLHGGPVTSTKYHFEFWPYEGHVLLAAKGYALFSPNYRGSTGYGDKFLTDLAGKLNDIEVEDILTGIDELIRRGVADKDKLGVMGWSNGGYLTNCLITRTSKFKAASSGGPIVDHVMQWGGSDTAAGSVELLKGLPWKLPDEFRKASPLYQLDKIRTPTIIHAGGSDERCPPIHARALYRALREYSKVPTELLIYPGEAHTPSKLTSRKAKMEWDLRWFDRYIRGHNNGEAD